MCFRSGYQGKPVLRKTEIYIISLLKVSAVLWYNQLGAKYLLTPASQRGKHMKELIIEAKRENLPTVLAFVDEQLEAAGCPMLTQTSIDVAVEEVFINIASYAYELESGTAVVQVTVMDDPLSVEITFIDNGNPYDPLKKEDPDITLPKQKRKKGGLGIFMVKKTMDNVTYEYKDGKNILTITKNLN